MPKRVNHWKRFEEDFSKSMPDNFFSYRLKDCWWWSNASNTRFTSSNLCDFIVHNEQYLWLVELKSTKQKSIPKPRQYEWLKNSLWYTWVNPIFIINFRTQWVTYIVHVQSLESVFNHKKSLSLKDCDELWVLLPQTLKRVRYSYDIETWLFDLVRYKL